MFTVKHETSEGDSLDPGVSHVWSDKTGSHETVIAEFSNGTNKRFDTGSIYVMNEAGKTIQIYRLRNLN